MATIPEGHILKSPDGECWFAVTMPIPREDMALHDARVKHNMLWQVYGPDGKIDGQGYTSGYYRNALQAAKKAAKRRWAKKSKRSSSRRRP